MKNINIPEPCAENWNEMTPSAKGAFCQKCALDVYDFSNKSGDEIRDILTVNIGSRVCGHIKKSQLEELNTDFSAWQMNNKQSFQRAWLFTLFVVFGMTLFSCEEDEMPVVDQFQKAAQVILTEANSSDSLEVTTTEITKTKTEVTVPAEIPITDPDFGLESDRHIRGMVAFEREIPKQPEVSKDINEIELEREDPYLLIDGGMRLSPEYDRYLVDRSNFVQPEQRVAECPKISGLMYPNPAANESTLIVNMPSREKVEIELIGLDGKRLHTVYSGKLKKGETEFPMDISALEMGLYLVVIQSGDLKTTVKFTKI